VFQKLLCLLHFWIDVTLYGDATGFSTFFFESLQSFFARAAFKVSNGQRRQERLYPPTTVQKIGPYFCRFACVQSRFGSFKVSLPLSKQFGCTGWCARLLRV
jgi:hypothetical protein